MPAWCQLETLVELDSQALVLTGAQSQLGCGWNQNMCMRMTLWIYLHVRNNGENKLKLAYMPLLNYDWNQQETWNFLHPGVKDPAQLTSEVHLSIWVFMPVNTLKYMSSDSQVAVISELITWVKSSAVQPILPAVCRFLLECQNSLLVLGIPKKEEKTESVHGYFLVTLFISVVYHMSNFGLYSWESVHIS